MSETTGTKHRGFASMDASKQRELASRGGSAAHRRGTAHEFTPEEAAWAGRKGGLKVSANRSHMAEIGRKGALARAARRKTHVTAAYDGPSSKLALSEVDILNG